MKQLPKLELPSIATFKLFFHVPHILRHDNMIQREGCLKSNRVGLTTNGFTISAAINQSAIYIVNPIQAIFKQVIDQIEWIWEKYT
jgi:hypothetical protein